MDLSRASACTAAEDLVRLTKHKSALVLLENADRVLGRVRLPWETEAPLPKDPFRSETSDIKFRLLQVYCMIKTDDVDGAAAMLENLPPLPQKLGNMTSAYLDFTEEIFLLYLLESLVPLIATKIIARDIAVFANGGHNKGRQAIILQRLYAVRGFTSLCITVAAKCGGDTLKWRLRHFTAIRLLVLSLIQMELFGDAIALIEGDILSEENLPSKLTGPAYLLLGYVYFVLGVLQKAETLWTKALNSDQTATKFLQHLISGSLYLKKGLMHEASLQFRRAVEQATTAQDSAIAGNNHALTLLQLESVRSAMQMLEDILLKPTRAAERRAMQVQQIIIPALRNLCTLYEFVPDRTFQLEQLALATQNCEDAEVGAIVSSAQ